MTITEEGLNEIAQTLNVEPKELLHLHFVKPAAKFRYEIRLGKFGMFFFDRKKKKQMSLQKVLQKLNEVDLDG